MQNDGCKSPNPVGQFLNEAIITHCFNQCSAIVTLSFNENTLLIEVEHSSILITFGTPWLNIIQLFLGQLNLQFITVFTAFFGLIN